ncbi:MAG: hypothetical protein P4L79_16255 [Legionella sp.]|uniref:DUF6998 domain-containing protein n=1 Tax=Legionella sp. TaxID=459 RepID=UPI00284FC544|nr:hypothetical protein [Legionella sp.]
MKKPEAIKVSKKTLKAVVVAIRAAIQYEKAAGRKIGITGEVAEVLVSHRLKLKLMINPIHPGCDAIDSQRRSYQIKSARKIGDLHKGRIGTISKHRYDFLIVALMDFNYKIKEIYKMPRSAAEKLAQKSKRRNPPIRSLALPKWQIKK